MCGVCGELRFDGAAPEPNVIERMKEKLQKRGPDSAGTYVKAPIALGHQRLAIIDLTEKAAQPMIDESTGVALVFVPELKEVHYKSIGMKLLHCT